MTDYFTPGVYFEEQTIGAQPIEGVSTSVAAFMGVAKKGPINSPTLVTSWQQFSKTFGDIIRDYDNAYLGYAVDSFFRNGGGQLYVVRVASKTASKSSIELDPIGFTAQEYGASGNKIQVQITLSPSVTTDVFKAPTCKFTADGSEIKFNDANNAKNKEAVSKFNQGDRLQLSTSGATPKSDIVVVNDIDILNCKLIIAPSLGANQYDSNAAGDPAMLESTDIGTGSKEIRVEDGSKLKIGSMIKLKQKVTGGSGEASELAEVESINGNIMILVSGTNNSYSLAADANPVTVESQEFNLNINGPNPDAADKTPVAEKFEKLSMNPIHPRYFLKLVNSVLVDVKHITPNNKNVPVQAGFQSLGGGIDDDLSAPNYDPGFDALTRVQGISLLAVPGETDPAIQGKIIDHCENIMKYRFAILDSDPGKESPQDVLEWKTKTFSDSSRAALYYPWIQVMNTDLQKPVKIPPSGAVAGIYARSDNQRGVQKAPANEVVAGALGLERLVTDKEQELLNPAGINVIRSMPGRGIRVWGARTLNQGEWKYINVRRLFMYLEESIDNATKWVVFEPNDERLWAQVRASVNEFLLRVWRDGALMGNKAEDAFFVKCDRTTMTQSDIDNGYLIVMIGVAPVKPAEFVVFKIAQYAGGAAQSV